MEIWAVTCDHELLIVPISVDSLPYDWLSFPFQVKVSSIITLTEWDIGTENCWLWLWTGGVILEMGSYHARFTATMLKTPTEEPLQKWSGLKGWFAHPVWTPPESFAKRLILLIHLQESSGCNHLFNSYNLCSRRKKHAAISFHFICAPQMK